MKFRKGSPDASSGWPFQRHEVPGNSGGLRACKVKADIGKNSQPQSGWPDWGCRIFEKIRDDFTPGFLLTSFTGSSLTRRLHYRQGHFPARWLTPDHIGSGVFVIRAQMLD